MPRIFVTLIFLFGAVVIGVFYLRPEWQKFQDVQKINQHLEEISAEFDELIKNRDLLVDLINTVSKKDLEKIDKALPIGPRNGEVLIMLENLAKKHSLALQSLSIQSAGETPRSLSQSISGSVGGAVAAVIPIKGFPLDISVGGSYESLKNLLSDFEKNLRLTDIISLSFTSPQKTSDPVTFSLKAKVYYQ